MTEKFERGITLSEIARCESKHQNYVQLLSRQKDFPKPFRTAGITRLFDWRQVNAYFRAREAKQAAWRKARKKV